MFLPSPCVLDGGNCFDKVFLDYCDRGRNAKFSPQIAPDAFLLFVWYVSLSRLKNAPTTPPNRFRHFWGYLFAGEDFLTYFCSTGKSSRILVIRPISPSRLARACDKPPNETHALDNTASVGGVNYFCRAVPIMGTREFFPIHKRLITFSCYLFLHLCFFVVHLQRFR